MFDVPQNSWLLGMMVSGDFGPTTFYTSIRQKHVSFAKTQNLNPPSQLQVRQRNIFRSIGQSWNALTPADREKWEAVSLLLHARMTGYHLWVWWQTKADLAAMRTIERNTNIQLII